MAEPQRKKWRRRKMETPYSRLTKIREAMPSLAVPRC